MRQFAGLMLVAAGAAPLFCWLAVTVAANGMTGFDEAVRMEVHGLASPMLTRVAETVTWLGTLGVLALFGAVAVSMLLSAGRREGAVLLVATMAGALVLENGLKFSFHRVRPSPFFVPDPVTYSFPSGHALFSLCFYGMLAIVVVRGVRPGSTKAAIWTATVLLVSAIGATRIYLGVHYPSDVLGGYLVAIAWIAVVLSGERRLRSRDEE